MKNNSRCCKKKIWKCLLCGRDKFTKKSPHNCNSGYRKRNIKWEEVKQENEPKLTLAQQIYKICAKTIVHFDISKIIRNRR